MWKPKLLGKVNGELFLKSIKLLRIWNCKNVKKNGNDFVVPHRKRWGWWTSTIDFPFSLCSRVSASVYGKGVILISGVTDKALENFIFVNDFFFRLMMWCVFEVKFDRLFGCIFLMGKIDSVAFRLLGNWDSVFKFSYE